MPVIRASRHDITGAAAGVPLVCPAWRIQSAFSLRDPAGRDRRNQPAAAHGGELGRRGYPIGRAVDLQLHVEGTVDRLGVAYADPWDGAETNVAYLEEQMYGAVEDEDEFGSHPIWLQVPPRRWEGRIQFNAFTVEPGPDPETSRTVFIAAWLPFGHLTKSFI